VEAAGANHLFVSVMDATKTEYLIPIYPTDDFVPPVGFGNLEEAQGHANLHYLEFRGVTEVRIGKFLEIIDRNGHRFWWYLHPSRGSQDNGILDQDEHGSCREDAGVPASDLEVCSD